MKRPTWSPLLVAGLMLLAPLATAPARAETTPSAARTASTTLSAGLFESRLLTRANYRRARHGCRPVRLDPSLVRSARTHSARMLRQHTLSHRLTGEADLVTRVEAAGYLNWRILAENLAYGQLTPRAVFRAWVASPAHRATLDNCRLRDVGFGVVFSGIRPWVTADYGRHAS
jgi:uncharacterized protein YkwD